MIVQENLIKLDEPPTTTHNTAYTLRAIALALWDIAPFGRNVVYAGNVSRNSARRLKNI